MKKEMYDASIHVGQFSLDEDLRIRCKNAQVRISSKEAIKNNVSWSVIGVCTFWENTESDNVIWETLTRKEQDVFYPWMDVYHTVKYVEKIRDAIIIKEFDVVWLQKEIGCSYASVMIIWWAVITWVDTIFTLYTDLLSQNVVNYLQQKYGILVTKPLLQEELTYSWWEIQHEDGKIFDLEQIYQDALTLYRSRKIDLLDNLLALQIQEKRT